MRPRYACLFLIMLSLAACTLGQAAPTPTTDPDIALTWTPVPVTPIVQPTSASPIPAGQSLPTALPMTNTPDGIPPRPVTPVLLTPLPLGALPAANVNPASAGLPPLSADGAAARFPVTLRAGQTVGINYSVTVQQGGTYEMLAFTDNFNGSYNLTWD